MQNRNLFSGKIGLSTLIMLLFLVFFIGSVSALDAPKKVTFVAGGTGGAWYNSAALMAEVIMNDNPDLKVTATGGHSISNARVINVGRDAHVGWTYLDTVIRARNSAPPFKKKHENIAVVIPGMLGSSYFVCDKKAGIKDWGDLKDKRVLTTPIGGATENLVKNIFALYGFDYKDIMKAGGSVNHVNFSQQATLMKDRRADCALFAGPPNVPSALVMDIESSYELYIPAVRPDILEKFSKESPGYFPYQLEPIYKCLEKLDAPRMAPTGVGVIITNKNFPDNFIYKIIKSFYLNRERLFRVNKMFRYIDKKNLKRGIPDELFHPGALKFINEVLEGKWK